MPIARTMSAVAAVLLLSAAVAAQGALDGRFIKLNLVAKGLVVDGQDAVTPATCKDTVYMFLQANGSLYDDLIFYELAPGVWETTMGFSSFSPSGNNEELVAVTGFTFPGAGDVSISCTVALELKIKLDAQDAFKSCTVKTLGGVLDGATLDGVLPFEGGIKVTGKVVPESKLPFPVV
ncbi:MAG: hypothetical protein FJ296_07645 [Planctomycetes bacterium]|nr:hypothetical protein [Planctomycetota bacterium]